MGIKGLTDDQVISIYDPKKKAFSDMPIVEAKKQMMSYGLTEKEIEDRIKNKDKNRKDLMRKIEAGEI